MLQWWGIICEWAGFANPIQPKSKQAGHIGECDKLLDGLRSFPLIIPSLSLFLPQGKLVCKWKFELKWRQIERIYVGEEVDAELHRAPHRYGAEKIKILF